MDIKLSGNYRELEKRLNKIQRKQLPFAFSKTLNDTAKKVRKQIVERTYPRSFDVRDKRFANATFSIKFSNKRNLVAVVFDRLDRANLKLHAKGGTKRAKSGNIAVPSRYVKERRSGRGVRKSLRPRTVVDTPKGYIQRGPRKAIYQSYGRKGANKRLLYSLKSFANIRKTFPFYKDANRTVERHLQRSFNVHLREALRSRRR